MSISSSLRLVVATWIAALLGALAGRSLAEASGPSARAPRAAAVSPASAPGAR
jgi:hypothetical protein